jgi:hypothetical protein
MSRLITEAELSKIINEEVEIIREIEIYHQAFCNEGRRLESEGYSVQMINEGIIDMLGSIISHAPSGVVDMFKAKLIRKAQEGLGFNPDSFLGRVVANVIEAIKLSELSEYFGPAKCGMLADMVIDGIAETLVEQPGDRIAASFGFDPSSAIWMTFRESITNALLSPDGIGGALKAKIKDFVCQIKFSDVMGGGDEGGPGIMDRIKGVFGGGSEAAAATGGGSSPVVPRYGSSS